MGFFKDFKNDMKQAVNELIPGNEEMVSEYDDEDMVNTLEEEALPEDEEYVNTMEQPTAPVDTPKSEELEEEAFDDVDLSDLDEFDLQEEDFTDLDEEESGKSSSESDPVIGGGSESSRIPADELAALLAEAVTDSADSLPSMVEEPEQEADADTVAQITEPAPQPVSSPEPKPTGPAAAQMPEQPSGEPKEVKKKVVPATVQTEKKKVPEASGRKQEENPMAEDKIIEITAMKGMETSAMQDTESATDPEASDSTTYISKGTRIEGNLFTEGSVDIIGNVEGDVSCYGKLIVSGEINGKVNASEIYSNAARITGEINSAGSVKIGVGSVIVGNVAAQSAVIAGAVNGDLDIKGPVIVDSTAVIMGNIKSRSVQINNGAVIEGFCSQSYSDVDVKSFFA